VALQYAEAHDIDIVNWYEERGVSGTKDLDDRSAFNRADGGSDVEKV